MAIPYVLVPALTQVPDSVLVFILLALSLALIFAGRALIKAIAFLAVGFAGAALGGTLVAQYVAPQWALAGIIIGFVAGGFLGVALLPLGVGLAVGYVAYLLVLGLLGTTAALVAGVIFFVVGALLSRRILGAATAVAGGLMLFDVLARYVGLDLTVAALVAAALTVVGLWVQLSQARRVSFNKSGDKTAV